MRYFISCSALLCLILSGFLLLGQTAGSIRGTVMLAGNKPVPSASIEVLRAKDSVRIQSAVSQQDGSFQFAQLPDGTYRLSISAIGFQQFTSATFTLDAAHRQHLLPAIVLQAADKTLQSVTVTAKKPMVEYQIDRTVVNVDASISNAGGNALEVLEKSPGVLVDMNGNISLQGKSGVIVLIDDKPTYLSGAELAAYLKSLSADLLDKIEIIPQPPAKYDAGSNAGVINIKTKKIKKAGFNGTLSSSLTQAVYFRTSHSLNVNFREKAFNYFASASFEDATSFNDLDLARRYKNPDGSLLSSFIQNSFLKRWNKSYNVRAGLDYTLNKKTTLGFMISGLSRPSSGTVENTSWLTNAHGQLDSSITASNRQDDFFRNGTLNFNFRHQYDSTGRELSMSADLLKYEMGSDQIFRNGSYFANNSVKTRDTLTGSLPAEVSILSFKADYIHPLKNKATLETGVKASYTNTDNIANYYSILQRLAIPDYDKTNHFVYDENIYAAYLNVKKDNKHFGWQLGLRAEHTVSKGHQLGNMVKPDSAFKREYTNIFPTVYFSYKPDTANRHLFVLSYSKRINRPYFKDLNPFISPLDKFTDYVGNPYLVPMFPHHFSLKHIYKNRITTSLFLYYAKDAFVETIELEGMRFISRPGNFGKSIEAGINVDMNLQPAKWWKVLFYGEVQRRYYKSLLYGTEIDTAGYFGAFRLINQWELGSGWSAEWFYLQVGKRHARQFVLGEFWMTHATVAKKILNNKGSLKLNVNDIFYTQKNHGIINYLKNAEGNYTNMGDSRQLRLSFTYNFGSPTTSQRNKSSAESEQERVR